MSVDALAVPDGFVPAAQYNDLLLKYETLRKTFHDYRKEAEERSEKAALKIKTAKESIRKWQAYIDKKLAKQALRDANQDFATPRPVQTTVDVNDELVVLPNPAVEAARSVSASLSHTPAHSKITSSQTTEDEASARSSSIIHSDDTPVVVSARTLKRKRDSPRKDSQAIKVKNELLSSSPHDSRTPIPSLLRTETSDLDAFRGQSRLFQQSGPENRGHPLSRNTFRSFSNPAPEEGAEEDAHDLDRTPVISRLRRARASNNPSVDQTIEAPEHTGEDESQNSNLTTRSVKTEPGLAVSVASNENASPDMAGKTTGSRETRRTGDVLRNLSPNTPTLPRTSAPPVTSGRKRDYSRGAGAVHTLAEDGDITRGFKKPRADYSTPKIATPGRLNQLLEGSSPQISRTVLSPRSAPGITRHREVLEQQVSRSVEKPISRITKTVRDRPSPRAAAVQSDDENNDDDPGPILPEHEPLRSRPLHRLNIDDFKINPKTSGGLGYAYRESVRKRDERKCLPGCTREECCGAIRRFIAAGGLPADTSLTDDELTLQGYLGPSYAQLIHHATEKERQDMLIEARTKAFADRHGKHRQAFERRATPPGFWRTEMPTTQELEEDREEARKLERQKVEERWRDAMRGGGRYMFRDEA